MTGTTGVMRLSCNAGQWRISMTAAAGRAAYCHDACMARSARMDRIPVSRMTRCTVAACTEGFADCCADQTTCDVMRVSTAFMRICSTTC